VASLPLDLCSFSHLPAPLGCLGGELAAIANREHFATQMPNNFKNQHHPELKREKQGSQGKRKQDVDGKEEGKPIHLELRAREYSFYQ